MYFQRLKFEQPAAPDECRGDAATNGEFEALTPTPFLPAGCSMQLDRVARDTVLRNLRKSIRSGIRPLVAELRAIGKRITLAEFLEQASIEPDDIYRPQGGSWTRIQREAGIRAVVEDRVADGAGAVPDVESESRIGWEPEERILGRIGRFLHMDDVVRIRVLREALRARRAPGVSNVAVSERRMLEALAMTLFSREASDFDSAVRQLWKQDAVRAELVELLDVLDDRTRHLTTPLTELMPESERDRFAGVPLAVHATYTRGEVLVALGHSSMANRSSHREGPLWHEPTNTEWFFVTLEKSERYYSPSTRYRDYAVSAELLHWESQSRTREGSPRGQRYIHHAARGSHVMLFVRRTNKIAGDTVPFTFLGPMTYVSHSGEQPMSIMWRLLKPMPLDVFRIARVAAGA